MAANAFALHEPLGERESARWGVSAAVIVALHIGAALLAMHWIRSQPEQGVSLPAIMIDMAPVTSAPQSTPVDTAPGPVMEEADASPPEPMQRQTVVVPGAYLGPDTDVMIRHGFVRKVFGILLTQLLVTFGMIFYRKQNLDGKTL